MTEQQWLSCTDPARMLNKLTTWLQDDPVRPETVLSCRPPSERKLRLFIEACREQSGEDYSASHYALNDYSKRHLDMTLETWMGRYVALPPTVTREWQCGVIRDIFGNPFRRVLWQKGPENDRDPVGMVLGSWLRWNDGIIPCMAQSIYDNRRFEDMVILADALQEAGCTNEDILMHCRGLEFVDNRTWATQPLRGPHVRGCWVLDLLLGKN